MLRVFLVTTLLLTFAPLAGAHGPCAHGAEAATAIGPLYLTGDGHVYQENGQHPGLQTSGGSCEDDNGRTSTWSADTLIL